MKAGLVLMFGPVGAFVLLLGIAELASRVRGYSPWIATAITFAGITVIVLGQTGGMAFGSGAAPRSCGGPVSGYLLHAAATAGGSVWVESVRRRGAVPRVPGAWLPAAVSQAEDAPAARCNSRSFIG